MKGVNPIEKLDGSGDATTDWRKINEIIDWLNRQWEIKLPPGGNFSAEVNGSDEKVVIDLSKLGIVETGCTNGVDSTWTVLGTGNPQPLTQT